MCLAKKRIAVDAKAERVVRFINNLTHAKGEHGAKPFNLRPWQEKIIRALFATRADGNRKHRTCLMMLPRKNGKSELCAAIGLYGLLGDGEIGAEVYIAAADRDQASLVYNVAAQMVRNDPELSAECEVLDSTKRIVHRKSGSVLKALSADAHTKHGFNASMVIYDELHAAPNRELWDVLRTSQGARRQPMMIAITTAGYDRHSILWQIYDYACKVRDGIVDDQTFLPVLYEAAKDADWQDEKVWHQANPALGDFRSLEEMRVLAAEAKQMAGAENTFRRLYLNQWTEQETRWINMDLWDACRVVRDDAALRRKRCYVGMDLSTTRDLTAIVAIFPDPSGGFDVFPHFFIPRDSMRERVNRDRVPYDVWEREGYLTATDGAVVNYEAVRAKLKEWAVRFDVHEIAYDPYNATDLVTRLQEQDGFSCIEMRQGMLSLAAPTKALEKYIVGKQLRHDGHPVLRWNVSNAAVEQDAAGNMKLSKKVSTERIDGAVALIMAVDRMERNAAFNPSAVSMEWV